MSTRRRRRTIVAGIAVLAVVAAAFAIWLLELRSSPSQPLVLTSVTTNDDQTGSGIGEFSYSGDWQTSTGDAKHDGDDHWAAEQGSRVTFRFRGTAVSLHGALAPHHGQATVRLDDGPPQRIDQYAPSRQDDAVFYESGTLPDGEHTVEVTVLGSGDPASSGTVVSIDRAVVQTTADGADPRPTAPATATATATTVFSESGDGPDRRPYASTELNGTQPLWHVEPGSAPVDRVDGVLRKVDGGQFHRMFSTERFGGPGRTLTISYRARATDIRDREGSSVVPGAKVGLKFPVDPSVTGYSKDDPRSVYGSSPQNESSPGSYQFLTGLTRGGYMELARNDYGREGYEFAKNTGDGYEPGTWMDVTISVEWLPSDAVRVRYWHGPDDSGTPVYEAVDRRSPFADEPGFLWLRTDDTDWEYDHITVTER